MTANEVREKYLKFFESKGHKRIPPAPLVLENDSTTLFTSSGMQPLVPYLMGEPHPQGLRVCDSQPSIRVQDIEEVGDNRHTTFFEMLGNWSFGDYFKKDQLAWIWEFLTKELKLPKEKLYVSIFEGGNGVPRDEESYNRWIELGVGKDHIFEYGVKKNWWSRSGTPEQMPPGEIGGPDSEIFFEFDSAKHDKKFGENCHPNCDCGRFLEIGNSVFIQYKKNENGSLEELPQKNVDFGGGLERLVAATNNDPDIFKIDVYQDLIHKIEKVSGKKYNDDPVSMRIIADHIRAAEALASDGVLPGNKLQGYVMRRLIRRSVVKLRNLEKITDNRVIIQEIEKFNKTLGRGLSEFEKLGSVDGKIAFDLYQTYGFPLELTMELAQEKGQNIDTEEFRKAFEKHQEKSRTQSAGSFKGGLADHSDEVTRLHTATHLIHAALRQVLGDHVQQKGSNITPERLRFDFTHPEKLTDEQRHQIETLVNEQIDKDLPVSYEVMTLKEAKQKGALAFFGDKYSEKVKVYVIGDPEHAEGYFSKEVCGGPHVTRLSDLGGHVTIVKEEASSAGVRRIYARII
jgi:alanyl-tRNA synthetase